jgi:hypothetical protein
MLPLTYIMKERIKTLSPVMKMNQLNTINVKTPINNEKAYIRR